MHVLGSDDCASNPAGSNQYGRKRPARTELASFVSDSPRGLHEKTLNQKRARAAPTQFETNRSKAPTRKEYADAGCRAAEWINSVPKGEARSIALRHMLSNLSKADKRSLRGGLCTVNEVEQVKLAIEGEMAEYNVTLREVHAERLKRRVQEMPETDSKKFNGILAFAQKNGSLDTRPETERDAEFKSTCEVTHGILKCLLMSRYRKGELRALNGNTGRRAHVFVANHNHTYWLQNP